MRRDFNFGATLRLLRQTMPFLVFRLLVYLGIAIAWIAVTAIGAALGFIGGAASTGAVWGGIVGFGLVAGVLTLLRRYLLYLVQAAHVAVLVEVMAGRPLPAGKSQVSFGQKAVQQRFGEASVLFGIDQVIKGVLRAFNRAVVKVADLLPVPGIDTIASIGNAIVNRSVTYVDEMVLANNLRTRAENPWESGRDGVILYAQNYKHFLRNAVWLTLFVWVLTAAVFVVTLLPAALLVALIPQGAGILTLLVALVLAWALKKATIEPFAVAAMLQVWDAVTPGQRPNPEWVARLEQVSKAFTKMGAKARSWVAPGREAIQSDGGAGENPVTPGHTDPAGRSQP